MVVNERDIRTRLVVEAGLRMMLAARTAPKGRGADIVETMLVDGEDMQRLSEAMLEIFEETKRPVYQRDAANILKGEAVLLIGTRSMPLGHNCGHCGFSTCAVKPQAVPCAINSVDVGIALGSACSVAADMRVDTRVMFSVGMGAMRLNMLEGCRQVFAIALSASSKNPFFDR